MSLGTRLLAVAAGGLVGLSLLAVPVHADDTPQYAPTMLVLDGSGSMLDTDHSGGTKMTAARTAAHTFINSAPDESKVGLTVYGTATGSSDSEKTAGCKDVKILQPPDTIDKTALNKDVDGVKPSGYTPIGTSLRKTAAALPTEGPRAIVLVSDGEDTCAPPDPCDVAKELHKKNIDLVVHTVGFGVDDRSRKQLTCVAQATGGTYSDAPDGHALQRVLPRVSAGALRNYKPAGAPIVGTASYSSAPVAKPGQYLDTIGQHETRYYAVDVPDGGTAYFAGTVSFPHLTDVPETKDTNTMSVRVYGKGGRDCHEYRPEEAVNSSDGVSLTVSETWDGAAKTSGACFGGGRYYFAVTWSRISDGVPARMPMEVLVGIEPKVTDSGPAASSDKVQFSAPSGDPEDVTGGGSFNVAGTLDGSGSYRDTVQRGEYVYFRTWLDWGEGLSYQVNYGQSGTSDVSDLSRVSTELSSPLREQITRDYATFNGSAHTLDGAANGLATVPVRYDNRKTSSTRTQSVPGWYYLAVKVSAARGNENAPPVPVTLDLAIGGAKEHGPTYATSVRNGIFGENATPGTPTTDADKDPAATSADAGSGAPVGWIIAGVVAIVVIAGAVVTTILVRGRRNPAGR